jgi:hypothetical protein
MGVIQCPFTDINNWKDLLIKESCIQSSCFDYPKFAQIFKALLVFVKSENLLIYSLEFVNGLQPQPEEFIPYVLIPFFEKYISKQTAWIS